MFLPAIEALARRPEATVLLHEGHYASSSLPLWRRAHPAGTILIYAHNPLSRAYGRREIRRLLSAADGVITDSRSLMDHLERHAGSLPVPGTVIPYGVNVHRFHPSSGPRTGTPVVAFVGQIGEYKGVHCFIDAAKVAAANGSTARFVVIGSARHGMPGSPLSAYELSLRKRARGLDIEFLPWMPQDQLAEHLRQIRVVCVPSLWDEPFGMIVLEAMASGAAVITSGRGGLREAGGTVARVVDPEDAADFAAAIRALENDELYAQHRARGLELAATASWDERYARLRAFSLEASARRVAASVPER